ncbi:MAG TPA: hypothetical protein EYP34_04700, partial [Chromatiaceae bacterium]|nr:hypothetical protein [Chromatiaceae bacterium]
MFSRKKRLCSFNSQLASPDTKRFLCRPHERGAIKRQQLVEVVVAFCESRHMEAGCPMSIFWGFCLIKYGICMLFDQKRLFFYFIVKADSYLEGRKLMKGSCEDRCVLEKNLPIQARLFKRLLPLLLLIPGLAAAAVPVTDLNNLPAEHFSGEQFCFDVPLSNTGTPGYGPYLRLKLPPEISFDSASFLGAGVATQVVGIFPPDLVDPISGET